MNYRFVKLIYPYQSKDRNLIRYSSIRVYLRKKSTTIYDTVKKFENKHSSKLKKTIKEVKNPVLLREIINLHNTNGIKSIDQIRTMVKQINSGKEIYSPRGLPNIRLVKTKDSEWILFDGHHSLLSYIITGRTYLHEIPHLIVENNNGHVDDKEILVFYGFHSLILSDSDWRKYVINWQAPKEGQLCKREQKNMGELFNSIRAFYNKNKTYNVIDV